ncbi:unnamed protein product [Chironomus riparius]|uniref:Peptidase S1 domain-containing protein n=1 Tax=Chironomus riparius TaxID=315576 RepID=A0A9N9RJN4_9DIPT|nr:unnamed protein product [Chironomus riparius]
MCMHFNECQKIKQLWKDKAITRDQLTICSRAKKIICCPTEEKISQKKCKEYGEKVFRIVKIGSLIGQQPHEIRRSMCTHKSISLIIGGTEAENHEFPHQALLGYATENTEVKWLCGGSLVSPNFVLTAAHCLFSRQIGHVQKVKVGMKYKDQEDDNRNVFIYNIKETFKHQNYNEQTFNEDIALLKLDGTVPINENILPICLPTKQYDDFKAIATGFGRTQTYGQQSEVLLKVALESFTHSECKESYPDDGIVQIDEETMLCFGHHSQRMDICRVRMVDLFKFLMITMFIAHTLKSELQVLDLADAELLIFQVALLMYLTILTGLKE